VTTRRRRRRRIAVDVEPLRASPAFRRLWLGNVTTFLGSQMTTVAAAIQVYEASRSTLLVGLLGFAGLIPLVLIGPFAGAVVDAVDRRRLCLATSGGVALLALALVAQAARWPGAIWPVFALVAAQSVLVSFDTPTRRVMVPRLLQDRHLMAANNLFQLELNVGLVAGPLLAGALIALVGISSTYLVEAVLVLYAIWAIVRLPPMPPEGEIVAPGWRSIREGLSFLRANQVLHSSFLVDINAMALAMPRALFPALAIGRFGMGAGFAGVLYAAPAIGALAGGLAGGWIGGVRRQGLATVWSVVVWGALIAAFGVVTSPVLAVALLAVAGLADMVSAVLRGTMLQVEVPDNLRGRMTSIYIVVVAGGPRLGDLQVGIAASLLGPSLAIVAGGCACVAATVAVARWRPRFLRYEG
jgi:MFS family permease